MKKIAVLLMVVLLSNLLVLGISAESTACVAYKTTNPPTLDGVVNEGEWGEPFCHLGSYEEILPYAFSWIPQDWPEYLDLYGDVLSDRSLMPSSIDLYHLWDEDYYYFAAVIKVETRSAPNYSGIWEKDCIFFNAFSEVAYSDDQFSVQFTVHDDGDFIAEFHSDGGQNPTTTDGDWSGTRNEATKLTQYELRFYWDELITKAVDHQMGVGDYFSTNICIAPTNFDGDPYNIIDIIPAGMEPNEDYGDNQYLWAITLADVEGEQVDAPAEEVAEETEAPAEDAEAPAEEVEETEAPAEDVEAPAEEVEETEAPAEDAEAPAEDAEAPAEEVEETEAEEVVTPVDNGQAAEQPATQTSDVIVAVLAVVAASGAALVASKKRS